MMFPLKKSFFLAKTLALAPVFVLFCGLSAANAVVLPNPAVDTELSPTLAMPKTLTLAGGSFWGIQGLFDHVKGVTKTVAGYTGGTPESAHYDMVSAGTTDHTEAVQIIYDPAQVTVGQLLQVFFGIAHDPTQIDRQDPDIGREYRSVIFYASPEQQKIAASYINQLSQSEIFPAPIATKLEPLHEFYTAEDDQQDYARLHPYNDYVITNDVPRLQALASEYPNLYVKKQ